jgi:transposase
LSQDVASRSCSRKSDRLLRSGLVLDDVTVGPDEVVITAHAVGRDAEFPECGRRSRRVRSRYDRGLSDVPANDRRVRGRLTAGRFRCPPPGYPRETFAARLDTGITRPCAHRTARRQQRAALSRPRVRRPSRAGHGPAAPVPRRAEDTLLRSRRAEIDAGEAEVPLVIGIDARATPGPEWREMVAEGINSCS